MSHCIPITNGVVLCVTVALYERTHRTCNECGNDKARSIIAHSDSPYYGSVIYCECGDSWDEDGRRKRPFRRGWREEAKAQFEKRWAEASDAVPPRCMNRGCGYMTCNGECDKETV